MLDFIAQHVMPTVLLIDDDMVTREVMATILTMSGYPMHTAAGGEQAVSMLSGDACAPSIILMDAQMPGLSGTALIEELRARSMARIYIISASDPAEEVRCAADGFLLKPFPPEALTRLIEGEYALAHPAAEQHGLDPAETVIDVETLAQLREMMPEAAIRQIFEAIIADVGKRIALLETAISKAEWGETRRIGHAIKGGGSMAGAVQIARLGEIIESGTLVDQPDDSALVIQDLRAAALNLQRMLDAEIKV